MACVGRRCPLISELVGSEAHHRCRGEGMPPCDTRRSHSVVSQSMTQTRLAESTVAPTGRSTREGRYRRRGVPATLDLWRHGSYGSWNVVERQGEGRHG